MHKLVRNSLLLFILCSVLIHLGLWTGLSISSHPSFLPKKNKIEITVLDQSRMQKPKPMQIVEQNLKPLNDETPEDAKYLSANNQRVVKETRASQSGDFRNSAGKGGMDSQANPSTPSRRLPTLSALRPTFDPQVSREINPTKNGGGPASQTNDHLKETAPSLETLLNTREFVYYTYYQRIRTQIRQFWEPSIRAKVKKIFAQGRSIASEHDHVTRVIIILNKDGALMKVQIVGESGLKDLDDAAVEAFRAAEPFPNPPKGIVETDGTIKINWDFVLEASLDDAPKPQRYARSP